MKNIKSITQAILLTQKDEDKCTNFLIWLLQILPPSILFKIISRSGLSITPFKSHIINSQCFLENSIPDAVIEIDSSYYIFIETKIYPNRFNLVQFTNHIYGGYKFYGDQSKFIFLSGDENAPDELLSLLKDNPKAVGFISWRHLLYELIEFKNSEKNIHSIIINEFLLFAEYYKLGKHKIMTKEEELKFFENYSWIKEHEGYIQDKLNDKIEELKKWCITSSNELLTVGSETSEVLPCIYRSFDLKNWVHKPSLFLFFDTYRGKLGMVLSGYENNTEKEKSQFLELWHTELKSKYKEDLRLSSYTWDDPWFKLITGTSGKSYDPNNLPDFNSHFYFGFEVDLDPDMSEPFFQTFSENCVTFINTFFCNS